MTAYWNERGKIRLKTDLVLELVDNFTNQLIQPCRLKFYINEKPARTTRNKNGLMVFCNLMDTPKKVRIESDIYQWSEVEMTQEEIDQHKRGTYIHRLVRLEPSKRYSIPKWATVVEGKLESKVGDESARYEALVEEVTDTFRIKRESADNSHVAIHMTNGDIMIGRQFFDADAMPSQAFCITGKEDDNFSIEPSTEKPLQAHALLKEIKPLEVQSDGRFMVVYPKLSGQTASIKLYKDKEKIGEFQIEAGKWNDLGVFK